MIWNLKVQMFTMINKEQPPEVLYKKAVLKDFSIFKGKHLCWSLFLIKFLVFRSTILLERYSNTGAIFTFLWILRNFYKLLVWRKSINGCFWIMSSQIFHPLIWRLQSRCYKCFSTFAGEQLRQDALFNKPSRVPAT